MSTWDFVTFGGYCVALIATAWWVSRRDAKQQTSSQDYFLAGNSLPWWAIGASLIAANISAEQMIGMSGSGYAIGLAIASYEWMAALTLILVAKFFLPIFLEKRIATMPQFLEQRYDRRVRTTLAVFWLGVYVLVNLTSVLYLGALAMDTITGIGLMPALLFLALFSLSYSLYGGLRAVAFTDIIQVLLLIVGGLLVSFLALDKIGMGQGVLAGAKTLLETVPDKFTLILPSNHPHYGDLPGLSVLFGGLWVMNFSYWGFNQYITQRALAAKNLQEAQKGVVFAAFLKLLMPVIVVLPGIAAAVLLPDLAKPDQAYPEMLKLVPAGLLGLTFAALVAAIASSVSSMTNSVATIFTLDIYQPLLHPDAGDKRLLWVGRCSALLSLSLAVLIAEPLLGRLDQAFQYIQEFTGFFTPGIVAIFLLGFFWKKTTANAALAAAIASALLSLTLKLLWPELPFMDRVGLVFLCCILVAVTVVKLIERPRDNHHAAIHLDSLSYRTSAGFNLASVALCLVLAGLYAAWW
ncbi:sodium/solute symporter [Shewanella cyperi]|uniref:Sodium/solute symporter n=1 Tax=Shewanella cyperi TaxID=2814292 RepID=A0A975AKR2_9GAMM|nr:sodium/solute symporter [Shewanella cyperi]QSX30627.1 sodium/solute symporter [Shewanella cyperi]